MNKEVIFNEIKSSIENAVKGLNLKNLTSTKEFIIQYLNFLEELKILPESIRKNKSKMIDEGNGTVKTFIENNTDTKVKLINTSQIEESVRFDSRLEGAAIQEDHGQNTEKNLLDDFKNYEVKEWQLSGGAIAVNKKGLKQFIPESVVRNQEIHLADIVRVTDIDQYGVKKNFKLIKKGDDPNKYKDDRIVYQKCEVEIEDGRLVVKKDMYGNEIKLDDEVPFTFVIKDQDRTNKNIEPGQLVDLAFYKGKAHEARVIWRHTDLMN
ncbi:hypothetical protein NQS33_20460 [Bacillus sp. C5(2022)]|uniref:hypothetical protein n=1 Tax=Bacillus sp. C5(2022) TaxID=2968453 RepID=UPI003306B34B